MKEKFYLSTAIAYTSKVPHIGNTYEAVLADAIVRYKRLRGYDVYFLTGTDEHGQKIEAEAIKEGITPQEHVDKIAGEIRSIWDTMNVSYDQFIRTTDEKHKVVVQKIFEKLLAKGDIYKSHYEGLYCVRCESFYTESQAKEKICPECGDPVREEKEEAYFFKLSNYQKQLEEHLENNPDFIYPEARKKEMLNNFIKPGLKDLCVSRSSFNWGIKLISDPKHVVYVWLDALTNYISALGYNPDGESDELYNKYWPADLHLIGKDIVRFHTIYWPIFLMALDLPLPKQVYGHPWVLSNGGKMSKSLGNTLYAKDLVEAFGLDRVRYCLLREIPFSDDGDLTPEIIISRSNIDLANILGNLLNRTISMSKKYFGGVVEKGSDFETIDEEIIQFFNNTKKVYEEKMDTYHVSEALEQVISFAKRSNKYIDETMPWVLAKDEKDHPRLKTVLYVLTENLRLLSGLLSPFIPDTAKEMLKQLNLEEESYENLVYGGLKDGHTVGNQSPIFERLEELPEPEVEKMTFKDEIEFSDWEKVDIRVCEVLTCEAHPKADKLLVLKVQVGTEERTVVSGLKAYYKPEELVGKKLLMVANLKPTKLRGVMSQGMILTEEHEGVVKVLEATLSSGSEIS